MKVHFRSKTETKIDHHFQPTAKTKKYLITLTRDAVAHWQCLLVAAGFNHAAGCQMIIKSIVFAEHTVISQQSAKSRLDAIIVRQVHHIDDLPPI